MIDVASSTVPPGIGVPLGSVLNWANNQGMLSAPVSPSLATDPGSGPGMGICTVK